MRINFNTAMPLTSSNIKNTQDGKVTNNSTSFRGNFSERSIANIGKYVAMGLGGVLLSIGGVKSCQVVEPGERGVKVRLGEVQPEVFDEGLHFKWPFVEDIKTLDIKTHKLQHKTNVYTKDIQQAEAVCAINYNLQPQSVNKLYQEVGQDYETKIIMPIVEGTIKDIIGKWNAQDLIGNREKAVNEILTKLQQQLKNNYVSVTNFQLTNIDYSDTFEKAIEEKVTAEQNALKAKNKTVQVEEEARQKIISAEAEAKSTAIRAEALTQNKSLVEYEAVQKWDGKLPQYMMGNSVPFVNLNAKK